MKTVNVVAVALSPIFILSAVGAYGCEIARL